MPKRSAGILLYRRRNAGVEVLLVHPGGPLWAKKDDGAWSIPKGEIDAADDPLETAKREFREETGLEVDFGGLEPLGVFPQPSGKTVHAWTAEGDCDPSAVHSNMFSMEWPPRSGATREFPEVDRAGWFGLDEARRKILRGQVGLIDELERKMVGRPTG